MQALARVIGEQYAEAASIGRITGISRLCFSCGQAISPLFAVTVYRQLGTQWPWLFAALLRVLALGLYVPLGGRARHEHRRALVSPDGRRSRGVRAHCRPQRRVFSAVSTRLANPSALRLQASIRSASNAVAAARSSDKAMNVALKEAAVRGIESIELFTCLTPEQRQLLIAHLELEQRLKGDVLIQQVRLPSPAQDSPSARPQSLPQSRPQRLTSLWQPCRGYQWAPPSPRSELLRPPLLAATTECALLLALW